MLTLPKVGFTIVIAVALVSPRAHADGSAPPLEAGQKALESSDYETAERQLKSATPGGNAPGRSAAFIGLARVQLATGRYAEAAKTAAQAESDKGARAEAAAVHADALARQGKLAEAISL